MNPGPAVRRRVTVRGRVQGVGFRYALASRAEAAGVTGWARNRADGTVEAVLEGPLDAVERMLAFCRSGPRGALVEGVDVADEEPERLVGFRVG